MKSRFFFLGTLQIIVGLYADQGCMDNSKYMCLIDGYDYKRYHLVECPCPCNTYRQSFHRGLCEQCLHFHGMHYSPTDE